jgi:hypothetical protein
MTTKNDRANVRRERLCQRASAALGNCAQEDLRFEGVTVDYVTGLDGWGELGEPSVEDRDSFCAFVVGWLGERYPGAVCSARVDAHAIESRVSCSSADVDTRELCTTIGTAVWEAWCSSPP